MCCGGLLLVEKPNAATRPHHQLRTARPIVLTFSLKATQPHRFTNELGMWGKDCAENQDRAAPHLGHRSPTVQNVRRRLPENLRPDYTSNSLQWYESDIYFDTKTLVLPRRPRRQQNVRRREHDFEIAAERSDFGLSSSDSI